ncbi:hypothetical protein [Streptomyces sp. NPDC059828]|uniref:hypothetical protein n=1 Tax=Streptomyces sp. NPDC059828 TaxID=3346965 RepID=UPI00364CE97D
MDPETYARLYGPFQPVRHARDVRSGRPGVTVLAATLWALILMSLGWLTCLVIMVAVWGAAEGAPVGGLLLKWVLIVAGFFAALTALAFAPGVRRLAWANRLLLLGVLAFPAPVGFAVWAWIATG